LVKLLLSQLAIVIAVELINEVFNEFFVDRPLVFLAVHVVEHSLNIPERHHAVMV
jgi:hypothetical protein